MLVVNEELKTFGDKVVRNARISLAKRKRYGNDTKALSKSLDYEVKVHKQSFSMTFSMEEYGSYLDQGVSGTKKRYNTRFSYKRKGPPIRVIESWIGRNGVKGRNKKGRFITNRSLAFLISRSIKEKGIKPTEFFTKAFNNAFKKLPDELIEAYGLEVEDFIEHTLNELPNKI